MDLPQPKMVQNEAEGTANFAGLSTIVQVSSAGSADRLMELESHGLAQSWLIQCTFDQK